MKINDSLITKAASVGNLLLFKYLHNGKNIPKDILFTIFEICNPELIKYILKQEEININAKNNVCFNNLIFQNNIWNFFKLFETVLMWASENGHAKNVKILVGQEGIDINAKAKVFFQ